MKSFEVTSTNNLLNLKGANGLFSQEARDFIIACSHDDENPFGDLDTSADEFWTDFMVGPKGQIYAVAADGEITSSASAICVELDEDDEMLPYLQKYFAEYF